MSKREWTGKFSIYRIAFWFQKIIFSSPFVLGSLTLSIIVALNFFETTVKPKLIYPHDEYQFLEQIAITHAEHELSVDYINNLSENIDYTSSMTKGNVSCTYRMKTTNIYSEIISVTLSQEISNPDSIKITRDSSEYNYVFKWRLFITTWVAVTIWIGFITICLIFYIIIEIIAKIIEVINDRKHRKMFKDY